MTCKHLFTCKIATLSSTDTANCISALWLEKKVHLKFVTPFEIKKHPNPCGTLGFVSSFFFLRLAAILHISKTHEYQLLQSLGDKSRSSTCIHRPFAAAVAGSAKITQVLQAKTRQLFICRFLSRRIDTHSEAAEPSVFPPLLSFFFLFNFYTPFFLTFSCNF